MSQIPANEFKDELIEKFGATSIYHREPQPENKKFLEKNTKLIILLRLQLILYSAK
jgi:hypothetical protein